MAWALSLVSIAASCGSGNGECRSPDDCDAPEECAPPVSDTPVCGIPCEVSNTCPDEGCPEDQVCVQYLGNCCAYGAELSSACVPRCPEAPCEAGDTCDADGRCIPDPCADGYACAPHFACDPNSAGADFHGCIREECSRDSECEGGACVLGGCYDSAGTCEEPQLVP